MSQENSNAAPAPAPADAAQPVAQQATAAAQTTAATVATPKGSSGFSEKPTAGELIEFQATGLLVVFVVLGAITLVCKALSMFLAAIAPDQYHCKPAKVPAPKPAAAPKPTAPAPAANASKTIHPGMSDEKLLAILVAAAHETLGKSVSVVKFRSADSMDWTWSIQGRVGLHSSHKI